MNILFFHLFTSYTGEAIYDCFGKLGHICTNIHLNTSCELYCDSKTDDLILENIDKYNPDLIFSINFWPPIARAANLKNLKYISYGYDSPQNLPDTRDMEYETNYIFLFDKLETESYIKQGIDRVYHLSLATDIKRWDRIKTARRGKYDISLIGRIYESTFPMLLNSMDDYLKGYFNAVVSAQQNLYGYYMIDELLDDKLLERASACFRKKDGKANVSKRQLSYSIGSYITHLDRIMLLKLLSRVGSAHLFTFDLTDVQRSMLCGVNIHGSVSYEEEMPVIFKESKINLCPVLRTIKSGIPQRALDIMGCGGFLLSSFQPEMFEIFVANEELVMYESYEDAMEKSKFYLMNDDIRDKIAEKGYEKVKKYFSYENKIMEMLKTAEI